MTRREELLARAAQIREEYERATDEETRRDLEQAYRRIDQAISFLDARASGIARRAKSHERSKSSPPVHGLETIRRNLIVVPGDKESQASFAQGCAGCGVIAMVCLGIFCCMPLLDTDSGTPARDGERARLEASGPTRSSAAVAARNIFIFMGQETGCTIRFNSMTTESLSRSGDHYRFRGSYTASDALGRKLVQTFVIEMKYDHSKGEWRGVDFSVQ